ncbi:hypothetical protein FGG08_003116 [Glutinoglossum americanum]|uniref:Kinesin light chain n=1 Tax=Glutinoglossum americanum TaxID=1670608 RepID=A0A9P8I802_9PEZI|nr:hypothetical protein FGG08_003116 [Glutinoglossum americanum]
MAELIAAGAAVGLASSFITFSDAAWRVVKRIKEYGDRTKDVPAVIKHIRAQLPVLIDKMAELKEESEDGSLIILPQSALAMAVKKCAEQINDLDDLTLKMCLEEGDTKFKALRKTLFSVHYEREVSKAWAELEGYKTTFILHFTKIKAPVGKLESLQSTKPIFMVPFEKDLKFVGRSDIMTKIDQKFRVQSRVALRGIDGVGKTQIAIEYCYGYRERHPNAHVFWVHASSIARFDQAYRDIARKLNLPGYGDLKANTLQLISEWLSCEDHGMWLMVLDNADDERTFFSSDPQVSSPETEQQASFIRYVPRSPKGSIIVTTRNARVGDALADGEESIVVLPLVRQDAERLLQSKLPQGYETGKENTANLLDTLGYLPLAITQAAAFISANRSDLAEYIETLQTSDSDLIDRLSRHHHDPRRDYDVSSSVIRTWALSFNQIRKQEPRAAQMLSLMAVLDRHGIPKSLLRRENEQRTEFTTALGTLQAFSLIEAERGGEAFVMHRLVQLSIRNWLELQSMREMYQEEAVELLSEEFPSGEHGNWKICETLLLHAQVVLGYQYSSKSSLLHRATLSYNAAWYEWQQGRYETAYKSCVEAHDAHQILLGESSHETLASLELLALVLSSQGNYEAARKMNQRVLELREKVLGKEHPNTLASMSNLASVLDSQGKYEAAEEMNQRALELEENVLGKEHPDTLTSMSNLASVLSSQGKYEAAEEMNRRVLELSEKVLGKEHPDTLTSMNNLALVLNSQGKYEAAEEMNRQALELRKKVLGKEHPDTLTSMSNLALVLNSQGKYEADEEMNRRVLELSEKVLGKEHPDTLTSMNNLALVLNSQGKYQAAEEMNRQALELREKVLGKEHPDTLASMSLALVLSSKGKHEAAQEMKR